MKTFKKELEELINHHSIESRANTPDFILAQYLESCLDAFSVAIVARDSWYGAESEASDEDRAKK